MGLYILLPLSRQIFTVVQIGKIVVHFFAQIAVHCRGGEKGTPRLIIDHLRIEKDDLVVEEVA